jgi:mono/diheme cytochrome c family protein
VNLRTVLIIINVVAFAAIAGIIIWRVISIRRNPEPKQPQNLEPFLNDEEMEGRKLERVLGLSLIAVLIMAVSIPLYFLVEPSREKSAEDDFDERAVERGSVLFANEQSDHYDPTRSLLCADCHGVEGEGGSTSFVIRSEDPDCDPVADVTDETPDECLPQQVTWEAPPLDVALLRYDKQQVNDIITYGRPGTPMPAWGVKSGKGILNAQGVSDLVAYLETLQLTPAEAKKRFSVGAIRDKAAADVRDAREALADAESALAETTDADAREQAQEDVDDARTALDNAIAYNEHVQSASDGELVFESQCARCHTKGWSYYNPLDPDAAPAPGPQGGGAYGPNLTDGSELRQFPGMNGPEDQFDWVANGRPANESYGVRGISSGRMPHYIDTLSEDEIEAVVEYERGL